MLIHKGRLESAAASERRAAHAKATSEEEMRMRLKMILTPCTTEGASQRVADLHRPNFANLKEELFFRHSLAAGLRVLTGTIFIAGWVVVSLKFGLV